MYVINNNDKNIFYQTVFITNKHIQVELCNRNFKNFSKVSVNCGIEQNNDLYITVYTLFSSLIKVIQT